MQKLRLFISAMTIAIAAFFCTNQIFAQTGNVGIGTTTPLARLHVTDSAVVFTGSATLPANPSAPPVSGSGTRMMWYPQKAAFRVGLVDGADWDKDNIGNYSFASGYNTRAIGNFSTSLGASTLASENFSTSTGESTQALGYASFSMGQGTNAVGSNATSMGGYTGAYGNFSLSTGLFTIARGNVSTSLGAHTIARAYGSLAIGRYNDSLISSNPTSWIDTDPIFMIGNGSSNTDRKNAMIVLKNGNTGIGTSAPSARLHVTDSAVVFTGSATLPANPSAPPVSGSGTRMMWYPQKAAFRVGLVDGADWDKDNIGNYSFASGYNTRAIGNFSTSLGASTLASENFSTSTGESTQALGYASFSMGQGTNAVGSNATSMGGYTGAYGNFSLSTGLFTIARGNVSTSLGAHTIARAYGSLAIGRYNDSLISSNPTSWIDTDPIFMIGNGSSNIDRKNAMIVLKNGNTGIGTNIPALSSGGTGLHLQNNTFTQLRLQSTVNNAGIEFKSLSGNLLELGTDNNSKFFLYDRTLGQWRMLVDGSGNVGIGTPTPTQKLHVIGNILASGTVSGTSFVSSSDLRYKKNIKLINNPLEKINAIRGVTYDFRTNEFPENAFPEKAQVGVIAQEVEKVLPEVVLTNDKGYKAVDYSKMVPLLIEGIKELKKENEDLKKRIEKLEKK